MKNLLVVATMLMTLLAISNIATAQSVDRDQFNSVQNFQKHRQAKQESKHRYQQQLQEAQARRKQQQVHQRQQRRAANVPQHRQQQAPSKRQYQAPRNHLTTALNNNPKCRINIQALADTLKRAMDAVYRGQGLNDRGSYVRVVLASLTEVRRAEAQCTHVAANATRYQVSNGDIGSLERSISNNRNRNTRKLRSDTIVFGNHLRQGGHVLTATILYEVVVGYLSTER